jgi:hypothetical protein
MPGCAMGLMLAIKRSYRYFLPRSLLEPRAWVRRRFEGLFLYFVGLFTGMFVYVGPGEGERVGQMFTVAMLVLIALKMWSGATPQANAREP